MQPHQERVVAEKDELDDKLAKLTKFVEGSDVFTQLPEAEKSRLVKQAGVMREYSDVLGERIAAF